MNYKRYMIFGYYGYYPDGGLDDCFKSVDSIEELNSEFYIEHGKIIHITASYNYYQILDRTEGIQIDMQNLLSVSNS